MATQTAPCHWWEESDETLATVMDVLERNAREVKHGRKR